MAINVLIKLFKLLIFALILWVGIYCTHMQYKKKNITGTIFLVAATILLSIVASMLFTYVIQPFLDQGVSVLFNTLNIRDTNVNYPDEEIASTEQPHVHSWAEATCITPKTCYTCGEISGSALGHQWSEATCTMPRTCRVCGEISGNALGHQWSEATCTTPRTCYLCGTITGSALGHQWQEATCDTPKTCKICGAVSGIALGHQWQEATYNDPRTCTTCGATEGSKKSPSSSLGLRDIISSAKASSVYSGDNLGRHGPEKMYDGKLDTNWTENASGNGIGEYVIFYFDDTYAVRKLCIYIGSHFNEGVYKQNCRPKTITLTFSDGSTERISLLDSYDEQIFTFNQYHYTDYVKLTIDDVYVGTKYLDTVIAELDFIAFKQ